MNPTLRFRTTLSLAPHFALACALFVVSFRAPATRAADNTPGDRMLDAYFRAETSRIASQCLSDIKTLDDWTSRRAEYRRQLAEMFGLWPQPARTDLHAQVTGKIDHGDYTVERLHFQSRPGLYVTANLFVPAKLDGKRVPAILYVCGHSPAKQKDGTPLGNKTAYQHHGAWFARNGYVCLVPDSLEFGEIDGVHHGLYRLEMWDWLSRGYTPAGVEAWNAIRCLDYLQSRPEVDPDKLGMTGRSGGGAYTWYTAALDERVKVAIPVAGMTDLQNQVVDGVIEGHCDCMFFVNTYRWDFPLVAALIAPRPMLLSNSDKDTIFPLDGVERLHAKVREIYKLYKADDKLGLLITEGPHKDTQDLQVPAFRWFNRFLKNDTSELKDALAEKVFDPAELRVFPPHGEPADAINGMIQLSFAPRAGTPPVPESAEAWAKMRDAWMSQLKERTFHGWPQSVPELELKRVFSRTESHGLRLSGYQFNSQEGVWLPFVLVQHDGQDLSGVEIQIVSERRWQSVMGVARAASGEAIPTNWSSATELSELALQSDIEPTQHAARIFFAPRGIGPTAWAADWKKQTQIRRRFELLGQTLDGMRVWDVRRAVQAIHAIDGLTDASITISASDDNAGIALYAALFEPQVKRLVLRNPPESHLDGTHLLNVLQTLDMPAALALAAERCKIDLTTSDASPWKYPRDVAKNLNWPPDQLVIHEARQ